MRYGMSAESIELRTCDAPSRETRFVLKTPKGDCAMRSSSDWTGECV